MIWYEQDNTTAVIKFYGIVSEWYLSAADFTNLFEALDSKYQNILIRVHCYGGDVIEGTVIYNCILNAKANTIARVEGICASMMTIIILACDTVQIVDNGLMMIHAPSSTMGGNAAQYEQTAKLLKAMQGNFKQRYIEKTGKKGSEIDTLLDGNDHWLSAAESKDWGFADEIVPAVAKSIKQLDVTTSLPDVETLYMRFAAALTTDNLNNNKNENGMKKLLINMLGLTGVTEESSDADVAAAVKTIKDNLTAQVTAQMEATINVAIASAETVRGSAFAAEMKATLVSIGKATGMEALQMVLGAQLPKAAAVTTTPGAITIPHTVQPGAQGGAMVTPSMIALTGGVAGGNTGANPRASWDWEKWQKEDPRGLEEMEKSNWDSFAAIYKAEFKAMPAK